MSQVERIIFITKTIEEKGGVTTKVLTERFEISRRQVLRDIEYLKTRFDAPIEYNPQKKHYHYTAPFALYKNSNEQVLISNAFFGELARKEELDPFVTTIVQNQLSDLLTTEYQDLTDSIIYLSDRTPKPNYEIFSKICDGLIHQSRLSMRYRSTKSEERKRKVEPLRLVNYTGIWYLIVYDVQRQDLRTFHVGRISELAVVENDHYTPRYSQEELDHYIKAGYGIFLGGEVTSCSFLATGWAQESLTTQRLHDSQEIQKTHEGIIITLPVANLDELISLLLSYGPAVKPLSPPELVERYRATIQKMNQNLL